MVQSLVGVSGEDDDAAGEPGRERASATVFADPGT